MQQHHRLTLPGLDVVQAGTARKFQAQRPVFHRGKVRDPWRVHCHCHRAAMSIRSVQFEAGVANHRAPFRVLAFDQRSELIRGFVQGAEAESRHLGLHLRCSED